jgi:hypothetical protein
MNKITAQYHNEFEMQMKELLNDIADKMEEPELSHLCFDCYKRADFLITNIARGSIKGYCNKCLNGNR